MSPEQTAPYRAGWSGSIHKVYYWQLNQHEMQQSDQSSHYDFENRSPTALFAKKWESHHTKEYSLHQKIGVPATKL